jgi:hypothetical protein
MNIKLTKNELQKVKELLDTKQNNISVAEMYLYFCNENSTVITKELAEDLVSTDSISEEEAYYLLLMSFLGIDLKVKENNILSKKYFLRGIKKLDPSKYLNNPYYQNIKVKPVKLKNWRLDYSSYLPYEGFFYDDASILEDNYFQELSHLGFFEEKFSYLDVSENDVTWMSVTPNEIETMEHPINEVNGKVITFGLGLGYFAYMASIKDEVSSVTIVEKNKDVIDLFTTYILPQFSHKDKINIIEMDAFNYANQFMSKENYDYAFVDLWHGGEDGLPMYLKMNKYEKSNPNTKFLYWLETSIIALFRRCVLTIVEEQLEGFTAKDYLVAKNETDKIINKLYFLLKDYTINSYDDLAMLIKDESLKKLALQLEI